MFLEKKEIEYETGEIVLVPFCEKCNSQNVQVVQVCKDCGSQDIYKIDLFGESDPRAFKKKVDKKEVRVYRCDYCGKEFYELPQQSRFCFDNIFEEGNGEYAENFKIDGDICSDCMNKALFTLNQEISEIYSKKHIEQVFQKTLGKENVEIFKEN